ncbi:ribosomal-protein-alanine N-acetyltransferase [Nitrobacteraceae bacterium AZCC 1564]
MGDHENFEKHSVVVFETPRLVLCAPRDSDLPELHRKVFSVPDVMRYVFNGVAWSYAEAAAFVREHFNSGSDKTGLSVLVEKGSQQVIGFAGLKSCTALEPNDLEIGFVLAREAWGKGFAREIGQAQLAFGFQELRCRRLLALVSPDNLSSIRTIEGLGMNYVRDLEIGGRGPRRVYCIQAEQWDNRSSTE